MPGESINASRFWDLYFRNAFLTLERHSDRYAGRIYSEPEEAQPPGGLVRDMVEVPFEVPLNILREYDYAGDGRFALITQRLGDLNAAIERIVDQTYLYREPAPFGKLRMSELFGKIHRQLIHRQVTEIPLADLQQELRDMVEHHTADLNQPIAALSWFLGELRERSSSHSLLLVVENSSIAPFARKQVHFTALDAAFSALWKVNDKACLWKVLEIMLHTSESGRRKIAPLFARLLSTTELLGLELAGSAYFETDFWASRLEPYRNFTSTDWDYFDANSLFWEIRYLSALRLSTTEVEVLRKLERDEVQTIRAAVSSRFNGSSP